LKRSIDADTLGADYLSAVELGHDRINQPEPRADRLRGGFQVRARV
jgi:hypothetical protein